MPNESTKRDVDDVESDEDKDSSEENGNKRRRTSGTDDTDEVKDISIYIVAVLNLYFLFKNIELYTYR